MNFYNEFDPKAAAWLRELIRAGLIPAGDVDERSITEIQPHELTKYAQCHFFAGIGGWSLALQLANWPATKPVWTGSCPCQPFSTAGKQLGDKDERHLWPVFFNLIRECRPEWVFGEQVSSAIGKGWLDGISSDLEGEGYACGAAVLGAHSLGSPHIRQRLFWVSNAGSVRCNAGLAGDGRSEESTRSQSGEVSDRRGWLGHAEQPRLEGLAGAEGERNESRRNCAGEAGSTQSPSHVSDTRGIPDPSGDMGRCGEHEQERGTEGRASDRRTDAWSRFELIPCADGKARRIEPGLAPLAHGIPARVVRLRGYGNAIVPQVAAEFITAFLES